MGMQCEVCEKKPVVGNQKTYRGKAKYLGGVGKKITGTSRRTFYPNLQCIRIVKDGKTVRANVCVQCIRSGKVQRPLSASRSPRRWSESDPGIGLHCTPPQVGQDLGGACNAISCQGINRPVTCAYQDHIIIARTTSKLRDSKVINL